MAISLDEFHPSTYESCAAPELRLLYQLFEEAQRSRIAHGERLRAILQGRSASALATRTNDADALLKAVARGETAGAPRFLEHVYMRAIEDESSTPFGRGSRASRALGISSPRVYCLGSMSHAQRPHQRSGRIADWERSRALHTGARNAGWKSRIQRAIKCARRTTRAPVRASARASSSLLVVSNRRASLHAGTRSEGAPATTRTPANRAI